MTSPIDDLLEGVDNPRDRLRLLMERAGVNDFVTELAAQVEQHVAVFWYEPGYRGRDLLADPEEWKAEDRLCCLFLHIYDGNEYDLENHSFSRVEPLVKLSTRWLTEYSGLDPLLHNLLVQIWDRMADTPFHHFWNSQVTNGMVKASENFYYLASEATDHHRVARFALRYHFRRGNERTALNQVVYGDDAPVQIPETIIDDMAEEMLRLGMTEEEVQDELIHWLDQIALNRHFQMWPAVYKARNIEDDPRRHQLLLDKLLPELTEAACSSSNTPAWMWKVFRDLLQATPSECQDHLKRYFRHALVEVASQGRVAFIFQFLSYFGKWIGIEPTRVPMRMICRDGFKLAFTAERWGVAAALGQQFSGVRSLADYPKAMRMALKLSEPIALDCFEMIRFED